MFILKELRPKKIRLELADCLSKQKVSYKARKNAVVVAGETLSEI
jgi:hypothetical protein